MTTTTSMTSMRAWTRSRFAAATTRIVAATSRAAVAIPPPPRRSSSSIMEPRACQSRPKVVRQGRFSHSGKGGATESGCGSVNRKHNMEEAMRRRLSNHTPLAATTPRRLLMATTMMRLRDVRRVWGDSAGAARLRPLLLPSRATRCAPYLPNTSPPPPTAQRVAATTVDSNNKRPHATTPPLQRFRRQQPRWRGELRAASHCRAPCPIAPVTMMTTVTARRP